MGSGWGQITCSLEPYISKCVSTTTCDRSSYFSNYMFLLSTRKHTHTHTRTRTHVDRKCFQQHLDAFMLSGPQTLASFLPASLLSFLGSQY